MPFAPETANTALSGFPYFSPGHDLSVTSHPLPATRRSRAVTKVAATAAAATLALGLAAAPAAAEGATGEYVGNAEQGYKVHTTDGTVGTTLFNLKLDDGTVLRTYCIDFETNIRGGAKYQEDAWDNYPGKGDFAEPAKVHWVLQNGYPQVDTSTLREKTGYDNINRKTALSGTQAAIWHFSNGIELDGEDRRGVTEVYDYLVENAVEEPQSQEPDTSLSITPASAEGKAGETIGEFLLETSADSVPVKLSGPEGAKLVDLGSGDEIAGEVANGTKFGVQIPKGTAAGEAGVSASISTKLHMGRLFKGVDDDKPTQTLIAAESQEISTDAGAKVSWTEASEPTPSPTPSDTPSETPSESPSPSPSETPDTKPTPSESPEAPAEDEDDEGGLPVTGAALGGLVAAAVAALGAGAAVMYLSRKRRSSSSIS
ncbi:hypothetical protein GCM10023224_18310 [Streptomonospora halophila]|uniref:Thioester domain-containing protein n=1 Tax=Streptomonospora halophila TaxID=427369 RepID=A0ABP9GKU6_9ACTN